MRAFGGLTARELRTLSPAARKLARGAGAASRFVPGASLIAAIATLSAALMAIYGDAVSRVADNAWLAAVFGLGALGVGVFIARRHMGRFLSCIYATAAQA